MANILYTSEGMLDGLETFLEGCIDEPHEIDVSDFSYWLKAARAHIAPRDLVPQLIFEMVETKDRLPEFNQRCLIKSTELDEELVFARHIHHGYFDVPVIGESTRRVYADRWAIDKPKENLQ